VLFVKQKDEADCHFVVFAPDRWEGEPREWTLRAWVRGKWVREDKLPMVYPTQLGIDISDWGAMERGFFYLATDSLNAGCEPLLGPEYNAMVSNLINHRDLVHPHREVRGSEHPVSESTSELLYSTLARVLDGIKAAIDRGWLIRYLA
jgi:hypothetical protein